MRKSIMIGLTLTLGLVLCSCGKTSQISPVAYEIESSELPDMSEEMLSWKEEYSEIISETESSINEAFYDE